MGVAQFTAGQPLTALEVNQLPVIVSYLSVGSVTNTAAETVIGTFTIPAGDPTFPGGYFWKVHGTALEAGSPTCAIRMRFGSLVGTQMAIVTGVITTATSIFDLEGFIGIESLGSGGTLGGMTTATMTGLSISQWQNEALAINTTISNNIVVTAQYVSGGSTSNTASTKFGAMYRL
jgi:hypothetical protein